MMGFKFKACRAAQRDLWDYAGERLAEGPMEQVERHLETCASCRREAAQWKKAQNFLENAQAAPLPSARLGWNDLQDRIAADVAAFGPPRPDKRHTQQAVSQLISSRRVERIPFLRPALAGGTALALAGILLTHRAPKSAPNQASAAPAPVTIFAGAPALLTGPSAASLLSAPTPSSDFASLPSVSTEEIAASRPQTVKPDAVKTRRAPKRIADAQRSETKRAKAVAKTAAPQAVAVNRRDDSQNDGTVKLKPYKPTSHEKKAPDDSEVAHTGVMATVAPVAYDENNGYY